jgi:hypothetical protein
MKIPNTVDNPVSRKVGKQAVANARKFRIPGVHYREY